MTTQECGTICIMGKLDGTTEQDGSVRMVGAQSALPRCHILNLDVNHNIGITQQFNEQKCTFVTSTDDQRKFMLHLPSSFLQWLQMAPEERSPWPLLIFMHGTGGCCGFFAKSKKALRSVSANYAADKFVIVSPVCNWSWKELPYEAGVVSLDNATAHAGQFSMRH